MSQRLHSVVALSPKNNFSQESSSRDLTTKGDGMGRLDGKRKASTIDADDAGGAGGGNGESSSSAPDWREEMRIEVRAAIADVMAQRDQVQALRPGPFEIDAGDVMDNESVAELVRKFSAENRSNKTAIRLAGITKEGNKQHFLDMVEIRESVEKAAEALKDSIVEFFGDVHSVQLIRISYFLCGQAIRITFMLKYESNLLFFTSIGLNSPWVVGIWL